MDAELSARWSTHAASLGDGAWRALGALAVEQTLGASTLARLAVGGPPIDVARFVDEGIESGLLFVVAPPGPLSLAPPPGEPMLAVNPAFEQLALRAVARRGELAAIARETRALLEGGSVSDVVVAAQTADLVTLARRAAAPRLPRLVPERSEAEWLRVTVCEPFDDAWFAATFGARATEVAVRVLSECLERGHACDELRAWARANGEGHVELSRQLAEHAILRGDGAEARSFSAALSRVERLGFDVASRFVDGDPAASEQLVAWARAGASERALGQAREPAPRFGAAGPLLALLVLGGDTPAAAAVARRWAASGKGDGARRVTRALRVLLRELAEPEAGHARLDVQRLGPHAVVWESYLSGLTVGLHRDRPSSRAAWAAHLVDRSVSWDRAGYRWLARQALLLARELDADHCARALEQRGRSATLADARPGELSLWERVSPRPEWRRGLDALSEVVAASDARAELGRRAAWYVDMTSGELVRPALQEARVSGGGWSHGRRLSLSELHEHRAHLPPEDQRVLAATADLGEGRRVFVDEAYEQLIGHPRVFDGARGQAEIEVVRGACRVETEDDGGYLRVVVEPEGAAPGVNVVPVTEDRLVVYTVTEAAARVIAIVGRGLRVPRAHEQDVVRVLSQLAEHVEVRSEHLTAERTIEPDSTPCLRFSLQSGAWQVQAGVRPFGERGRFFVAGLGPTSLTLVRDGRRLRCVRELATERERVDALVAACPSLSSDEEAEEAARAAGELDAWTLGEAGVLTLLAELRDAGPRCELEWPEATGLKLAGTVTTRSLTARLRREKGWYLLTGGVRIDAVNEASLAELARAPVLAGGRFVRLQSGDYVEIERRMRRVLASLAAASKASRAHDRLELHEGAVSTLRELTSSGVAIDGADDALAWLERVSRSHDEVHEPPPGLTAELRPYQLDGYRFLRRLASLGLGACLADDMGLGKTVQLIALLVARADEGPALVVAPTSVCTNWARELSRFAPGLVPVAHPGDARDEELPSPGPGHVVITSYAWLQQNEAQLTKIAWATVVLDEAQFIKNAESQRARAASRLRAAMRVVSTGTPVENHYGDLWSLFRFANPGLLGDWPSFRRRFVLPIERDGDTTAGESLRELVSPYILRRSKRDVLSELPPVTEVTHEVRLSSSSSTLYALLRRQIHDKLFAPGDNQSKLVILAELTRLRRFCCHPRLVFPDAAAESDKLQAFLHLVEELRENGHRALVFSQYVDFLGMARESLDERGVRYEYLDGRTPAAARQARVDAFQEGSAPLFLISLKAGGFGLNLTAADYVIHLDPWWNPAVEAQATDRAHRIGQSRNVTVYRLVTKDTIEERIVELHAKKQRLARQLFDGTSRGRLELDELVGLLD